LVTGAYILHSGWQKWRGDEKTAQGVHGMAVGAYPVLQNLELSDGVIGAEGEVR
jgi:hypothetical protein